MIKVGVIGCGSIATHRHIPEYLNHEDVEVVAFCDIEKKRSDECASLFGGASYQHYEDLLKDETIDAVSICTPNYLHAKMSVDALNAGKHVLCEKPMATSLEEAQAMIDASNQNNKLLMIGQNQRFTEAHMEAKVSIEKGLLGKIYSFKTSFGHGGPEGWSVDGANSWFFDKERAFIGAMGDLGVHKVDLMHYLLGETFTHVSAMIETSAKVATVDDNAVLILKTKSGIIGTLSASWVYNGEEDNSTIIYGEKGILKLNTDPEYSYIFISADGEVEKRALGKIQTNDDGGQTNTGTIDHFVSAIQGKNEISPNGAAGLASLSVIIKALQSAQKQTIEEVK